MWISLGVLIIVASFLAYYLGYIGSVLALIGAVVGIIMFFSSVFGVDAEFDASATVDDDDRD